MKKEKILYFDCASGISGDMTLGALAELGIDVQVFLSELGKLRLDGYQIKFEKVVRNAVTMNHARVILEDGHEHHQEQEFHHEHAHHHEYEPHCGHEHVREHGHAHRSFRDIREMIESSELSSEVKERSLRIFTRVAKAEAKVHNKEIEDVQFHEVGAVDSIVDIVGCAILISMLKPDRIYSSVVSDGHGFILCQHGLLSVPVPAVSEIFAASDVIVRQIDIETELVTPTGAAIIAELAEGFGPLPQMKIEKIGWGAGSKILSIPNGLKVFWGSRQSEEEEAEDQKEEIMVLQTNLDDCTGEMLGYAMEKLFAAGALDVFYSPIYMKKNRPAWCMTVLTKPEDAQACEKLMFTHTTTIGIRKHLQQRSTLKREYGSMETKAGTLQTKKVNLGTEIRSYIEYESAVRLAESSGRSLWEVMSSYGKSEHFTG